MGGSQPQAQCARPTRAESQQHLRADAGVLFCVSKTKRDTGRVFGIKKDPHTFTARNEEICLAKGFG